MKITKNQVWFILTASVLCCFFHLSLTNSIENRNLLMVYLIPIMYAVLMFSNGFFFGKRDRQSLALYDVGFRFHVSTYIIHNLVTEIYYLFDLQSIHETYFQLRIFELFWGVGLLLHLVLFLNTRKHAIKGIKKEEIFE